MTENTTDAPESTEAAVESTTKAPTEPQDCVCGQFEVLVNVRESENPEDNGDLVWDAEHYTGCGDAKTRNVFAPGHDAKLKSFLIRMGAEEFDVARRDGGMLTHADAQHWADEFGFGEQVRSGIAKLQAKNLARATREETRAAKLAEREAAKAAKKAEREAARAQREQEKADAKAAKLAEAAAEPVRGDSDTIEIRAEVDGQVYTGTVADSPEHGLQFTYDDGQGNMQTTNEFAEISDSDS